MISREAYEFFRNINGSVGRHAEAGLHLARAEAYASEHDWTVEWQGEDDVDLSWCECQAKVRDARASKHDHEVLCAVLKDAHGKVLGSLGNIVDADHAYTRLVEAELASEAMPDAIKASGEDLLARDWGNVLDRVRPLGTDTLADMTRWGRWNDDPKGPFGVVGHCGGSDYSGTLVERSNYEWWVENYADGQDAWWVAVSGGYRTFGIVVDIAKLPADAVETLEALESYPLISEDHHSSMEMDAQDEAWRTWGRRDFAKAIADKFNVEDADLMASTEAQEAIDEIFWEILRNGSGGEFRNEQGSDMYLDVERVVRDVTAEDFDKIRAALPDTEQLTIAEALAHD